MEVSQAETSLVLSGTCCPPTWRPVSVLRPAARRVGGVEEDCPQGRVAVPLGGAGPGAEYK